MTTPLKDKRFFQHYWDQIVAPGDYRKCLECLDQVQCRQDIHKCSACGLELSRSAFTNSQWKNRSHTGQKGGVCITCEQEQNEKKDSHKCSRCDFTLPREAFDESQWTHRFSTTQEGGVCIICKEKEHVCFVCKTPLPEKDFPATQWRNRLQQRATCTACFFPKCTTEDCQLCKRCHDPACTQPNKCKRALLQPPVALRPKNKDERDTFKCVLCLYTKCTGCGTYAKYKIKKRHLESCSPYTCVACSQRELSQKDKALCTHPK